MKLRLSWRARRDIDAIGRDISAHDPVAAKRVGDAIRSALTMLTVHPQAGRMVGKGLHRFAVPRLPYLIFYKVDVVADAVQIVTIRHAARREEH
ncbi:Plasmid stabilization system protein ParE [Methylobacterium sp. 174MFSha1.1]|uniref:type II toxin-antitoxin system RelE/ParE family toxin n=1 Tax=Methylobacterium sp. 174MFSha1.1 TaxID=1502749 RepID=UPI0008EF8C5A|nr:type II toxin-antitoxin system RelE/ParE family toxin [Methylobacterium sp. 174MFSha1.1]SFV09378.1 Plasmid stabilization system protein ParE [Methylobacterium sp. 174MFSha1.1]